MRGERDKLKLSWPINLLANMSKYWLALRSQERRAAAVIVAEAYEEARFLGQIELDLMVAAKVIRDLRPCGSSHGHSHFQPG